MSWSLHPLSFVKCYQALYCFSRLVQFKLAFEQKPVCWVHFAASAVVWGQQGPNSVQTPEGGTERIKSFPSSQKFLFYATLFQKVNW